MNYVRIPNQTAPSVGWGSSRAVRHDETPPPPREELVPLLRKEAQGTGLLCSFSVCHMAGRPCARHWIDKKKTESCLQRIWCGGSDRDDRVLGKKEAEGAVEVQRWEPNVG